MNRLRRQALLIAAGMGAVAVAGAFVRPGRQADGPAPIVLDQLFPKQFGTWRLDAAAAAFVRPANEITRTLYQQVLERGYIHAQGWRVMLSVAYGQQQSGGLELHWPEVCYRYGGFAVTGRHAVQLQAGGMSMPVTRLIAEMPMRPEPITYWAVLGGERVADANSFRLRRLHHAVRRVVADGLLVRVSSIDPLAERAFDIQADFIDALLTALDPAARQRVAGLPEGTAAHSAVQGNGPIMA